MRTSIASLPEAILRPSTCAMLFLLVLSARPHTLRAQQSSSPVALQCDSLTQPLGLDETHPTLSWKLVDSRRGARQTAYQVQVYTHTPAASDPKPDVWDSGRVSSGVSTGIAYDGPALLPATRYFWRVRVWGADGQPYPASTPSWWETGLLQQSNWHAAWIGYEEPELHSVRESGAAWITNPSPSENEPHDTQHDFRFHFALSKAVAHAALYATGEDTAAAWLNDRQVLKPVPLPPWQQLPWGHYQRVDVTAALQQGDNLLAIGITRYKIPHGSGAATRSPMSAVLSVTFQDGSSKLFISKPQGWKAMLDAPDGWWRASAADASWAAAELYQQAPDPTAPSSQGLPWPTGPVASLRKTFTAQSKTLVSARLYATALGAYKFFLNGAPVGDQVLAPGWMDFREHVPYQVYDVTRQVSAGNNALAAYLAPGWYSTPLMWFGKGNNYGPTQPALKAQLRLQYSDGSVDWVATDASWKANTSAIRSAEIYDGETRDARLESPGWDRAGFADTAWQPAMIVPVKQPELLPQYFQPIRQHQVLTAVSIHEPKPGVYVIDFGQNMSAMPRLHVHGKAGDDIQLRFAEVLNSDGTLYVDNLRTAKATDHFILAGKAAAEDFQPLFTFHGFRYAEITGIRQKPTTETLKAVVLHTDAPFTTTFSTGDTMVNKLYNNILWGQRSNFVGVPTDCPQRDERLGWSADAQVFWRTASFNMDLSTFSRKYAADLHGTQVGTAMYGIFAPGVESENPGYGAAWSDAGVIVPWTGWIQTGNRRVVDENWTGMEQYLAQIERENPNHLWQKEFGAPFGDWLTPTITTPEDLLATAYWAYDASLMQQMAIATGRTAAAGHYQAMFNAVKAAFQKAYIGDNGFVGTIDHFPSIPPPTVNPAEAERSKSRPVETQTGYVLALYMHLMPEDLRAAAADRLVARIRDNGERLGTGFLGTPYLLAVLSDTGHSDVAYTLLLNRQYPSWGYLIDHGATTTWERWNGDQMRNDPSMNSYNHYAYGAVAEWIYRYAAGIDTDPLGAGFHTVYLHPNFDARLGHLSLDYNSAYGPVHSAWTMQGTNVNWTVIIPPNSSARLATLQSNATHYMLDGSDLRPGSGITAGSAPGEFILPAGTYHFSASVALSESHPQSATGSQAHTEK